MTQDDLVLVEDHDAVVVLQLNRPAVLNALSPDMIAAIWAALERLDRNERVRAVVIAGHERAFVAGADIKSMRTRPVGDVVRSHTASFWSRLAAVEVPLVAAVSGPAFGGGCELALACDLVVASETASFAQSEIRVGIMPGGGGTQRLARTVGKQRAMEMVLLGEPVPADVAHTLGLVNRVSTPGRWREDAIELAHRIAAGPPMATRAAKKAVQGAFDTGLGAGMSLERRLFELVYASEDRVEGMTAFLERRAPRWKGR
jgi:enoyl-CoA hydratase/carnithine racemase